MSQGVRLSKIVYYCSTVLRPVPSHSFLALFWTCLVFHTASFIWRFTDKRSLQLLESLQMINTAVHTSPLSRDAISCDLKSDVSSPCLCGLVLVHTVITSTGWVVVHTMVASTLCPVVHTVVTSTVCPVVHTVVASTVWAVVHTVVASTVWAVVHTVVASTVWAVVHTVVASTVWAVYTQRAPSSNKAQLPLLVFASCVQLGDFTFVRGGIDVLKFDKESSHSISHWGPWNFVRGS